MARGPHEYDEDMHGLVTVTLQVENYNENRRRVSNRQIVSDELLHKVGLEEVVADLVRGIRTELEG